MDEREHEPVEPVEPVGSGETDEPVEPHPATWENVVVGKAKKLVGRVLGDEEYAEEGEEQEEIAHEVAEHRPHPADD